MSTLPVPSKGALRALRHIAIGTSCTVAFATGVVTEDRRRRIHSAREVNDNARRIKASRKYHSAGTAIAATLDEQVMNYGSYSDIPKDEDRFGNLEPTQTQPTSDLSHVNDIEELEELPGSRAEEETVVNTSQAATSNLSSNRLTIFRVPFASPKAKSIEQQENKDTASPNLEVLDPQRKLAHQIMQLIRKGTDEETLTHAVDEITRTIANGMEMNLIMKPLQAACQLLLQACQQCERPEIYIAVLESLLTHGPIQEQSFWAMGGIVAINNLLYEGGFHASPGEKMNLKAEPIRRAAKIFLAEYKSKPAVSPRIVLSLGRQLCTAARLAGLYDLSISMFWRLNHVLGFTPRANIADLIHAECHSGHWRSAQKHFLHLYTESKPAQSHFYSLVSAVVGSTLRDGRVDGLAEILQAATNMAVSLNLVTSTTWFLKYLQALWDTTQRFSEVEAAFNQLEPLVDRTSHPQAIYTLMLQMCVNAGLDSAHIKYYDKLNALTGPNLRSLGYLALAKAKKGDWEGVEEDFVTMKDLSSTHPDLYSSVFAPILGHFIATHDICESEGFIKAYIQKHKVTPNQTISNMMINMYAKAGELDAITKWLAHVRPFGCKLDAVTVGSILASCRNNLKMPFQQLLKLAHHMVEIDTGLIDEVSLNILHLAATADANGKSNVAGIYRKKIEVLGESLQSSKNSLSHGNITDAIDEAYAKGNMSMVTKLYRKAFASKIHIDAKTVSKAVNAILKMSNDGDIRKTAMHLKEAKTRGLDVSLAMTPLLLVQMEKLNANAESVESMATRVVPLLRKKRISLSPVAISKAISILVRSGKYRTAIEHWGSLSKEYPELSQKIDIVNLTVLLKAYIGLSDSSGIQWVMGILSRDNLLPDARFKLELKSAIKINRRRLNSNPDDENRRRLVSILSECLTFVLDRRSQNLLDRREAEAKTLSIMKSAKHVRLGAGNASGSRMTVVSQPVQSQPSTTRLTVDVGRQKGRVKIAEAHRSAWPTVDAELICEENIEGSMPRLTAKVAG